MSDKVPTIMENVFECTLEMINKDFSEYPQHRVEFFKLLKAINLFCFPALLKLDGRQFKFVIDSCMWASKHDNREVETTGLSMCIELMDNMAEHTDAQTSSMFFQQFYITILQDVFFVLTDSDHKAGKSKSSSCYFTVLTSAQASSCNHYCSRECSISWKRAKLQNRFIPQSNRLLVPRIASFSLISSVICYEVHSQISKCKAIVNHSFVISI